MIRALANGLMAAVAIGLVAACDSSQPAPQAPQAPPAESAPAPQAAPPEPALEPASCLDERGEAAAQRLADRCRQVSPATNPPCNVANPCVMIQGEIDRACALWAQDGDVPAECAG